MLHEEKNKPAAPAGTRVTAGRGMREPAETLAARRRSLVAPQADERLLVIPALDQMRALADRNAEALAQSDYDCQGRPLAQLRSLARREAYDAACRWVGADNGQWAAGGGQWFGERSPVTRNPEADGKSPSGGSSSQDGPGFFVAGHQPELFHPGVWVKNFVLSAWSRRAGRLPLNLIVDNDNIKSTAIRVPTGSASQPTIGSVSFDRWEGPRPFEGAGIGDTALFQSFGHRVARAMEHLPFPPLIQDFWPLVLRHAGQDEAADRAGPPRISECFARARHELERSWGFGCLELPISRLCQLESFRWFASHLLAHLPRFREVHNACLAEFRRRKRIRSPGRPVPALAQEDQWDEAPFWVWQAGTAQRRRLFARPKGNRVLLRSEDGDLTALPLRPDGHAAEAVAVLCDLEQGGWKLRPRALSNTLFARLVLGDLFIHGIGGAKYDELTDDIIRAFYGFEPPDFVTLTATLRLPQAETFAGAQEEARKLAHWLRDLAWNPDRHLQDADGNSEVQALILAKRDACAARPLTPGERRWRFSIIRGVNQRLQPWVESHRRRWSEHVQQTQAELAAHRVLSSREYAFCLYPAEKLASFYRRVCMEEP